MKFTSVNVLRIFLATCTTNKTDFKQFFLTNERSEKCACCLQYKYHTAELVRENGSTLFQNIANQTEKHQFSI